MIRPTPDFGMLLPYKNDISEVGFTHTLCCHGKGKEKVTNKRKKDKKTGKRKKKRGTEKEREKENENKRDTVKHIKQ